MNLRTSLLADSSIRAWMDYGKNLARSVLGSFSQGQDIPRASLGNLALTVWLPTIIILF